MKEYSNQRSALILKWQYNIPEYCKRQSEVKRYPLKIKFHKQDLKVRQKRLHNWLNSQPRIL